MTSSSTTSYAPPTIPSDSYSKLPLSGASTYTAEPQEMPIQAPMPSMQVPLSSNDHHPPPQPPIRTQYAYVQGTSAPPQLSVTTTSLGSSDHSLSIPRYVDSNPRSTKSPRHSSHQSVHSTSSITNDTSPEYRYGPPPYVPVSSNSNEINSSAYSGESSHTQQQSAPRDYYPPTTGSWTTSAGESTSTAASYHNGVGDSRPYGYTDQYKTSQGVGKSEPPATTGHTYASGLSHYSWSPT
jgi:hypothetical protein